MGYDCGSGGDRRQPEKQSKLSPLKRKKKRHVEMSAGTTPQYLSLLLLKAFIPQHEQHHEIKDTEMLFNHFHTQSIVLLAFAFTPHPVHLHGLLLCCQLISHPPAPAKQPAVAGCEERETLVAVRKRKGMKHRDKSSCHIEQVPRFRSPLIIPMLLKTWRAHILHACAPGSVCVV